MKLPNLAKRRAEMLVLPLPLLAAAGYGIFGRGCALFVTCIVIGDLRYTGMLVLRWLTLRIVHRLPANFRCHFRLTSASNARP